MCAPSDNFRASSVTIPLQVLQLPLIKWLPTYSLYWGTAVSACMCGFSVKTRFIHLSLSLAGTKPHGYNIGTMQNSLDFPEKDWIITTLSSRIQ